jgi:hypothetical protein
MPCNMMNISKKKKSRESKPDECMKKKETESNSIFVSCCDDSLEPQTYTRSSILS